jgi:hypothetical protein
MQRLSHGFTGGVEHGPIEPGQELLEATSGIEPEYADLQSAA